MTLALNFDELLRYTNGEREKWRAWLLVHPEAMDVPVQPEGRYPTIGKLIDHIFLVERRHLQRLMELPIVDRTGLTGNNAPPLFDYGASVRRELEQYVADPQAFMPGNRMAFAGITDKTQRDDLIAYLAIATR